MASSDREIKLTLSADATGDEKIKALAAELAKLGQEGGSAAPVFEKLSNELADLANQQALTERFGQLKKDVDQAKQAMVAAGESATASRGALATLSGSLEQASAAEAAYALKVQEARAAVLQSSQAYAAAKSGLSSYIAEIGGVKNASAEQAQALQALRQSVLDAKAAQDASKTSLQTLNPEYKALQQATAAAAKDFKTASTELSANAATAEKARENYKNLTQEMQDVHGAMQRVGVDSANLEGEQGRVAAAIAKVVAESARLKDRFTEAGTVAATAGQRIENAFGIIGVRSAASIQAEILRVDQALMTLARDSTVTGSEFDRAFSTGKAKIADLESQLKGVQTAQASTTKGFGGILGSIQSLIPAMGAAFVAQRFVSTNMELENIERTFRVLTGSAKASAAEMDYVRNVSNRLGTEVVATTKAYASLTAATKGTAVEGKATKDVFEAVTNAMAVAGKTGAETERALQALSQMASKGVVSMEELRQQLGEALPGALNAAAAGFGINTAELNKMVESGRVTADQLFPAMTRGLNGLYTSAKNQGEQTATLTQTWNRFSNQISEVFKKIGDGGAMKVMNAGLDGLTKVLGVTFNALSSAEKATVSFTKRLFETGKAFAEIDFSTKTFKERLTLIKEAFESLGDSSKKSIGDTAKSFKEMVDGIDRAALAQAKETEALKTGANAAQGTTERIFALGHQYQKLEESTNNAIKAAENALAARKAEAESIENIANAFGTEKEKLDAIEKSTVAVAAASAKLAEQKAALLALAEGELETLREEIEIKEQEGKKRTDQEQKRLDDLQKLIATRRGEADEARAQAEASKTAAAAAKTESAVYADNSEKLETLRESYEKTHAALENLRAAKEKGVVSQERLNAAEREAGEASRLYRDALSDQLAKINAINAAKQGEVNLAQAQIRLQIEQQKNIQQLAKARGDEYTATQAGLKIKELEIKMVELSAKAKDTEANAAIAGAKIQREQLQATGQLTAAKEVELQAIEAAAQVKKVEAEIFRETAKGMRELADATQYASNAAGESTGNINSLSSSLDNATNSANKTANALRNLDSVKGGGGGGGGGSGDGGGEKKPDTKGLGGISQFGTDWKKELLSRGVPAELLGSAERYVEDYYQEIWAQRLSAVEKIKPGSTGFTSFDDYRRFMNQATDGAVGKAWSRASEEADAGNKSSTSSTTTTAPSSTGTSGTTSTPPPTKTNTQHTTTGTVGLQPVTINIGSGSTALNLGSQADARALEGVLRQLAMAKSVSS